MNRLIVLGLLSLCYSCTSTITGNGKIITQNRGLKDFSKIQSSAAIKVEVTQDSVYKVEVWADENIIDFVETKQEGPLVKIQYKTNKVIKSPHVTVKVTAPKFDKLDAESSSNITTTNTLSNSEALYLEASSSGTILATVDCNKLDVEASSSGSISIAGKSNYCIAKASSSGNISSQSLTTNISKAVANSSGHIQINANTELDAAASSSGEVQYKGNATIKKQEESGGRVVAY